MKKTLTEQIVETIIFLGHATINDIYCDIKALKPNVQKGRIEKIIFTLCENGTIEKLKVDGFDDYYEISKGPHNHFICSNQFTYSTTVFSKHLRNFSQTCW